MDTQDREAFFNEATKAFKAQVGAAEACLKHPRTCFICRGGKSRWTRWFVNFLFECHAVKSLAFEAKVAKADADEYRMSLEELTVGRYPEICRELGIVEDSSLQWLENLYTLRDDRSE